MEICVDIDNIKLMKSFVFDEEQEYCINLEKSYKYIQGKGTIIYSFKMDTLSKGIHVSYGDGKQRASCTYKIYSSVLFHSHPKLSRSYPSFEDIKKLRHDIIQISIIATRWGIYTIKKTSIKLPDFDNIQPKLNGYLYKLQLLEDKTGYSRLNKETGKTYLEKEEIKELEFYLGKLSLHSGLKFNFYPWTHFQV